MGKDAKILLAPRKFTPPGKSVVHITFSESFPQYNEAIFSDTCNESDYEALRTAILTYLRKKSISNSTKSFAERSSLGCFASIYVKYKEPRIFRALDKIIQTHTQSWDVDEVSLEFCPMSHRINLSDSAYDSEGQKFFDDMMAGFMQKAAWPPSGYSIKLVHANDEMRARWPGLGGLNKREGVCMFLCMCMHVYVYTWIYVYM